MCVRVEAPSWPHKVSLHYLASKYRGDSTYYIAWFQKINFKVSIQSSSHRVQAASLHRRTRLSTRCLFEIESISKMEWHPLHEPHHFVQRILQEYECSPLAFSNQVTHFQFYTYCFPALQKGFHIMHAIIHSQKLLASGIQSANCLHHPQALPLRYGPVRSIYGPFKPLEPRCVQNFQASRAFRLWNRCRSSPRWYMSWHFIVCSTVSHCPSNADFRSCLNYFIYRLSSSVRTSTAPLLLLFPIEQLTRSEYRVWNLFIGAYSTSPVALFIKPAPERKDHFYLSTFFSLHNFS